MSFKKIFSNTRGEAASLVLIVSMILATLGIITGSRVVENRIKTSTQAQSQYNLNVTLPTANSQHYLPLQLEYRGSITGAAAGNTARVLLKVYKTTNWSTPLVEQTITSFNTANNEINFSGVISGSNITLTGDYALQVIPYGYTGTIIGTHAQIPFSIIAPPTATVAPPAATNTPVPSTVTSGVWSYNLTCGNGRFSHSESTNGKFVGNYCYDITINNQPSATGCGWGGSTTGSGVTGPQYFYQEGKEYSMRGRIWDSTRTTLLVDESIVKSCGALSTSTPVPPPATNTPQPTAPSSPRNGVWEFTMSCANGRYSYTRSTKGQYTGAGYCVDIWINDGTVYSGCGTWPGSQSFSGAYNQFYFAPNVYTLRGKVWNADRTQLLVDESLIKSCVEPTVPPATNTPTPTATPSVIKRPDVLIPTDPTTSFNTQGGMTLSTVIKNAGDANVNFVGNHVMDVQISPDNASPGCSATIPVAIAGLTPQATITSSINAAKDIYSRCPSFTPQPGKSYRLTLTLDPNDSIKESNETNNTKSVTFTQPAAVATNTPTKPAATNTPKPSKPASTITKPAATATKPVATKTPTPTKPAATATKPAATATTQPSVQPTNPLVTNTPLPPSATNVDVTMNVTIINPQANFTIWGTAQELTGSLNVTPTPVKCNTGDSTKSQTTVICRQLKRGKNYEFVALAKAGKPNAQTIQSAKNTYIIPGGANITPQNQNKTLTLPAPIVTQEPTVPPTNTPPAQTTATPTATATPNPDYNFEVTLPTENSTHYLPLQLEYRGSISGAASGRTARIDLKLYKYPINTNIPLLETRISSFNTTNNSISFSGLLTGSNVNTVGDYVLQLVPYGQTGTIIGSHKEVRFSIVSPATATPSPIPPANSTPTPTPLRPLCTDLQVTGDSATKYDVIFLPSGYTDYNQFVADAREAMSYYKVAVPDADLQGRYNFKAYTDVNRGYDVTACTKGSVKYPCWSNTRASDTMRSCNGDAYVVLVYTPKPSEDAAKASEAFTSFGNKKGITLGKYKGAYLVLRYDISYLSNLVSGNISENNTIGATIIQAFQNLLQKFR